MKTTKHTFFCENIDTGALSEEESHHASRVLRLKQSDLITVINGNGTMCVAEIIELSKKNLHFKVIESHFEEDTLPQVHIAIAPTKSNDRFEYFLEKVTELGVSEITPLLCSNSERKNIKLERFEKIIMSATKQSGNLYLPKMNTLTKFPDFLAGLNTQTNYYIAHCEDNLEKNELKDLVKNSKKEKNELKDLVKNSKNVCILIGPEGDFTNEEITLAKENKIIPVGLGKTRLRTETAGVIACHTIKLIL